MKQATKYRVGQEAIALPIDISDQAEMLSGPIKAIGFVANHCYYLIDNHWIPESNIYITTRTFPLDSELQTVRS